MVGHFQLEKVLGSGHHGVVFRARDLKTEQEVALKVFSPDFPANDAEMQEFIQAMRTALPLRHASLVAVNGAGKSGPYVWLSRELVSGLSLAQIMHPSGKSREGLDWRLALRVAVHVGQALELVHRQHLIHSNVTPQNILIVGNEGQVKLNDLMVRKALDRTALGQSVAEQKFLADLPYLAPEQTDPDAFVDNLCDVYSLGVVVYALMTGRLPFRGKTPEEILDQIRTAIPAKPKKFERSIPSRFQEVVLKMMAKKQEDRYPTPTDLLADLDSIAKERDVPV
jgi:eukaryotic-like serine/threonine-protein kinase